MADCRVACVGAATARDPEKSSAAGQSSGPRVEVGARREPYGEVLVWVADSGVGMGETAGEGTGLANLKARLRAFFGERAKLDLSETAPHGVRAEVRVPA